ncbi:MAG: chloride channel protein, partial [Thermoguttaceae bacterium]|nr:chloride channel protein [Thermoguttaceae bacterium]
MKDNSPSQTTLAEGKRDVGFVEATLDALRHGPAARRPFAYLRELGKQLCLATFVGLATGAVGAAFQYAMRAASEFFRANYYGPYPYAIFAAPFVGLAIVFLYRMTRNSVDAGTDRVVEALTAPEEASQDAKTPRVRIFSEAANSARSMNLSFAPENKTTSTADGPRGWKLTLLAPLIFLSSVLTQFCGGSAGREGAALQLGGCIGLTAGKLCRLRGADMHIALLCGMSGGFAAVFGTPLTAAVFALEIARVGVVYYPAFLASLISALIGSGISSAFRFAALHHALPQIPDATILTVLQTLALGVLCGLACIFYCRSIRFCSRAFIRRFPNDYLRAFFGGIAIIVLTFFIGTDAYNGVGLLNIKAAF